MNLISNCSGSCPRFADWSGTSETFTNVYSAMRAPLSRFRVTVLGGIVRSNGAAARVVQGANAAQPRSSPWPLKTRGFFVSGDGDGAIRPEDNRTQVAAGLGGGTRLRDAKPCAGPGRRRTPLVPAR